jgi:hypothetical protein
MGIVQQAAGQAGLKAGPVVGGREAQDNAWNSIYDAFGTGDIGKATKAATAAGTTVGPQAVSPAPPVDTGAEERAAAFRNRNRPREVDTGTQGQDNPTERFRIVLPNGEDFEMSLSEFDSGGWRRFEQPLRSQVRAKIVNGGGSVESRSWGSNHSKRPSSPGSGL